MIADTVDENELITGKRQEGMFASAIAFSAKATSGIGGFLAGVALDRDRVSHPGGARDDPSREGRCAGHRGRADALGPLLALARLSQPISIDPCATHRDIGRAGPAARHRVAVEAIVQERRTPRAGPGLPPRSHGRGRVRTPEFPLAENSGVSPSCSWRARRMGTRVPGHGVWGVWYSSPMRSSRILNSFSTVSESSASISSGSRAARFLPCHWAWGSSV